MTVDFDELPENWGRRLDEFHTTISVHENFSDETIESYLTDLVDFCRYCSEQGIREESGVDSFLITDYLEFCRNREYSDSTISRRLSALNRFFTFLKDEEQVESNPLEKFDSPRNRSTYPDYLDNREVERLLDQPDTDTDRGVRDRTLLEVLYGTGVRVSELVTLTTDNVQPGQGTLRVMGKGNKERIVPMGREAFDWLDRYYEDYRSKRDPSGTVEAVFLQQGGQPITRTRVWQLVREYAREADLNDVSPHTLRHTYATHLLENGADIRSIQKMLGHSDVGTTADFYLHMKDDVLEGHRDFHPRGQ